MGPAVAGARPSSSRLALYTIECQVRTVARPPGFRQAAVSLAASSRRRGPAKVPLMDTPADQRRQPGAATRALPAGRLRSAPRPRPMPRTGQTTPPRRSGGRSNPSPARPGTRSGFSTSAPEPASSPPSWPAWPWTAASRASSRSSPTRTCSPSCAGWCPACTAAPGRAEAIPLPDRVRRRRAGGPGGALVRPGPGDAGDRQGAGARRRVRRTVEWRRRPGRLGGRPARGERPRRSSGCRVPRQRRGRRDRRLARRRRRRPSARPSTPGSARPAQDRRLADRDDAHALDVPDHGARRARGGTGRRSGGYLAATPQTSSGEFSLPLYTLVVRAVRR